MAKHVHAELLPGRVPKIADPELRNLIVKAVKNNMPYKDAVQLAGVSESVIYLWKRRGKLAEDKELQGETLDVNEQAYLKFLQALRKARSQCIQSNVDIIQKAAERSWQAAAWLLERSEPGTWALHRMLEISGPDGGPIEVSPVDLKKLSTDELNIMRGLVMKASGKKELGHEGGNGNGRNGDDNGTASA